MYSSSPLRAVRRHSRHKSRPSTLASSPSTTSSSMRARSRRRSGGSVGASRSCEARAVRSPVDRSSSSRGRSTSSRPSSRCRRPRPWSLGRRRGRRRSAHGRRSTGCSGWGLGSCSGSGSRSCATPSTPGFGRPTRSAACWGCRCSPVSRPRPASSSATAGSQ